MAVENKIIGIFCYRLPYKLSNQIYNEFENRFKDAKYLIQNYSYYKGLKKDVRVIELLLALSIFHKRLVSNLDAAVKFYGTVTRSSKAEIISIGGYKLNASERNKLLGLLMHYNNLRNRFKLPVDIFEYLETKEFLRNIIKFKDNIGKRKRNDNDNTDTEIDIPF